MFIIYDSKRPESPLMNKKIHLRQIEFGGKKGYCG